MLDSLSVYILSPSSAQGCKGVKGCKSARVQGCCLKWHFSIVEWHFSIVEWHFSVVEWHFRSEFSRELNSRVAPSPPLVHPSSSHPLAHPYTLSHRGCKGTNALNERNLHEIHTPLYPRIEFSHAHAKRIVSFLCLKTVRHSDMTAGCYNNLGKMFGLTGKKTYLCPHQVKPTKKQTCRNMRTTSGE